MKLTLKRLGLCHFLLVNVCFSLLNSQVFFFLELCYGFELDFFALIDKEINDIVNEQQKDDAELAHERSELEQLKQDVANANKHIQNISKALEKKVLRLSIDNLLSYVNLLF